MANKYVNFNAPSPYASQQADLERRQRLAELMQQQAMQPIETNNTSITPTQGLAKVLQSYLSAKQLDKINTEQRNIEQSQVQEIDDATNAIAGRLTGRRPTPIPTGGTPEQLATAQINAEDSSKKLTELIKKNEILNATPLTKEELKGPLEEVQPTGQYIKDPQDAMRIALTRSGGRALQANPALASMLSQYIPKTPKYADIKPSDYTGESLKAYQATGDASLLVAIRPEKTVTLSSAEQMARGLGLTEGTPEYKNVIQNYMRKDLYVAPQTDPNSGKGSVYTITDKSGNKSTRLMSAAQALDLQNQGYTITSGESTPNASESTAGFQVSRMLGAVDQIAKATTRNPKSGKPGVLETFGAGDYAQSSERKVINPAIRTIVDAALNLSTGAAYTTEQLNAQLALIMPTIFDDDYSSQAKKEALQTLLNAAKDKSGSAWTPKLDAQMKNLTESFFSTEKPIEISGPGAAYDALPTGAFYMYKGTKKIKGSK